MPMCMRELSVSHQCAESMRIIPAAFLSPYEMYIRESFIAHRSLLLISFSSCSSSQGQIESISASLLRQCCSRGRARPGSAHTRGSERGRAECEHAGSYCWDRHGDFPFCLGAKERELTHIWSMWIFFLRGEFPIVVFHIYLVIDSEV